MPLPPRQSRRAFFLWQLSNRSAELDLESCPVLVVNRLQKRTQALNIQAGVLRAGLEGEQLEVEASVLLVPGIFAAVDPADDTVSAVVVLRKHRLPHRPHVVHFFLAMTTLLAIPWLQS